jgi:DNA-binding response OmpR family regulator
VNMPGMDGFELCTQLRQVAHHAATPVVFLTGLATVENRTQSAVAGGTDFIAKPFNLYELTVKALTHILRGQIQADRNTE